MQQILLFNTGKTTCSETPAQQGNLCRFVAPNLGEFKCQLFNTRLYTVSGWLQRCPECLDNFKGVTSL